jgi:hypothetical protein
MKRLPACIYCGSKRSRIRDSRGNARRRVCCFCGLSFDTLVTEQADKHHPSAYKLARAEIMREYRHCQTAVAE